MCGTAVSRNPDAPINPSKKCRALAYYHLNAIQGRPWNGSAPDISEGHGESVAVALLLRRDSDPRLGFAAAAARVYPDTGLILVDGTADGTWCPEDCCKAISDRRYVLPDGISAERLGRVVTVLDSCFF